MKHIKLFEDFNPGDNDYSMDEQDEPSYYVLKDGRFLIFWEEPFGDMGGETNYMYKYRVGEKTELDKELNKKDSDWNDFGKEVTYKEVEQLLSTEDKKQHDKEREDLFKGNEKRSKNWVE